MKSHRFSNQKQLADVENGKLYLAAGTQGDGVAQLQLVLRLLGYALPRSIRGGRPDGIYGAETEGAVRQFQAQFALKADGIVGRRTLAALDALLVERPCFDTASPAAYGALVLSKSIGPHSSRLVYHT